MPKVAINFREMHEAGGSLVDRINPRALAMVEASEALNCQLSHGVLEKALAWQRLSHITVTGYSMKCTADGQGCSFPDHADYDLGNRWTIFCAYKATDVAATYPILWRADTSNNKVTALEINTDGAFVFTHRDSGDNEDIITSAHTIGAGETGFVMVQRYYSELRMFVDNKQSAMTSGVHETNDTKASSTKFYVGVNTVTDGDTPSGSCRGAIDDVRVFRDEIRDHGRWTTTEYPWLGDPRLVLYARLNDDSYTDYSKNGNDGSAVGAPTTNDSSLVTAIAPILKLFHVKLTDGTEQWMVFSNGAVYAVDVT